jgi:hypothetical protein
MFIYLSYIKITAVNGIYSVIFFIPLIYKSKTISNIMAITENNIILIFLAVAVLLLAIFGVLSYVYRYKEDEVESYGNDDEDIDNKND